MSRLMGLRMRRQMLRMKEDEHSGGVSSDLDPLWEGGGGVTLDIKGEK